LRRRLCETDSQPNRHRADIASSLGAWPTRFRKSGELRTLATKQMPALTVIPTFAELSSLCCYKTTSASLLEPNLICCKVVKNQSAQVPMVITSENVTKRHSRGARPVWCRVDTESCQGLWNDEITPIKVKWIIPKTKYYDKK
jgi:hypothetical protein